MNKIRKTINYKNLMIRLTIFFIASFIAALNFNLFLAPNNIVFGGISGLAIVAQHLFDISIPVFLNVSLVILFFVSLALLSFKTTLLTLFGFATWNAMVMLTMPIASHLNAEFTTVFIMLLFIAIVNGICFGLIYRSGFNTGGADVILLIMNKYLKMPMGLAGIWLNIFIIGFGFIVFGPTKTIYAVFILVLGNKIIDRVTLGIKDSKMCFIKSAHNDKIEEYLIKSGRMGVTRMRNKGGFDYLNEEMLLIIMSTEDYYGFKYIIQEFDAEAFITTMDCYAVTGGFKKQILPF